MSAFEPRLRRALLLTGFWAGHIWSSSPVYPPPGVPAGDYSGGSLGEHRLRTDYLHVPLPFFGALGHFGSSLFVGQPDMQPYFVGGHYDRPIPRRIAEEAGVRRGTFAIAKQGAASMLQRSGRAGFAPATAAAIERFAAAEGKRVSFAVMPGVGRPTRALIKLTRKVPLDWLARRLEQRRLSRAHFEPRLGNVLLRWAVSVVAPRYDAVRRTTALPASRARRAAERAPLPGARTIPFPCRAAGPWARPTFGWRQRRRSAPNLDRAARQARRTRCRSSRRSAALSSSASG